MANETVRTDRSNVIHVDFATGSSRPLIDEDRFGESHVAQTRVDDVGDQSRGGHRDPIAGSYTLDEVHRVLDISKPKLRAWARSGLVVPAVDTGQLAASRYSFQDLIGLRVVRALTDAGLPIRKIREAVHILRDRLPAVSHPLAELRVTTDGRQVVVQPMHGTAYQVGTGQLLLDLDVGDLAGDVVLALSLGETESDSAAAAYDAYLQGCRMDEEPATWSDAEAAYRRAVALDPSLANAWTNLGNLRYRRGDVEDARSSYASALQVDAEQPEAHYNLGFLLFEEGCLGTAIKHFQNAVDQDPAFADAHFNLALALEEVSQCKRAREHWSMYLQLDPTGPWADVARAHLLS